MDTSPGYTGSFENFIEDLECTKEEYRKAIRSTLKQAKVFLKREPNAARTNAYSPKIISLMRSNMDMQWILDAYAAVGYVVDYINKSSAGLSRLLRQTVEECNNGNVAVKEKMNRLANILYNCSEVSAQEAAWCRLRLPMSCASIAEEFINTSPQEVRYKKITFTRKPLMLDY